MAGPLEITLRDVYERVTEISTQLGKFAGHLESVDQRLESGQAKMADHESRIRVIEQAPKGPGVEVADHEMRIRSLERFQLKAAGGLIALNGGAVFLEWLLFVHK